VENLTETQSGGSPSQAGGGKTLAGQPLIVIAETGKVKLILCAIPWAMLGLPLLVFGAWMAVSEALHTHNHVTVLVGCGCAAAGWMLAGLMVCRLRAAFDKRIRFLAGPGGIQVAFPGAPRATRLFMAYQIRNYEIRADQLQSWHPYVMKVNGVPMTSAIIFKGKEKWQIWIHTRFFNASRVSLVCSLSAAFDGWKNAQAQQTVE
jgi:hypothetical protein